jgi:predicted phage terminase large subunit-like protein
MQMMRQKIPNMIGIKPAQGGSKTTRVQAVAPIMEAGNFYIPQRATWTEPFVSQCALFPASKNDDMIDSVSQALNWATRRPEFRSTTATYGYGVRAKVGGPKIDGFE